jgi:Uma2 family endonuclease
MYPDNSIYQRRYTVEEYFALEEQSDIRHEYYHGEIFPLDGFGPEAMAGGTKRHNRLIQNCAFALRTGLQGRSCEIFAENVRLALADEQHFNYPDVVVSCDPTDDDPRTVHAPVLIIEVLSKSTEARDRGWKFEQYQSLPSLQQYVLVSQYRMLIDSFVRTNHGTWELTPLRQPNDVLQVPSLDLAVALSTIYEHVSLDPIRLAYE